MTDTLPEFSYAVYTDDLRPELVQEGVISEATLGEASSAFVTLIADLGEVATRIEAAVAPAKGHRPLTGWVAAGDDSSWDDGDGS